MNEPTAANGGSRSLDQLVILRGGKQLTIEQAQAALDEAMELLQVIGTTGMDVEHYKRSHKWMTTYYPQWA